MGLTCLITFLLSLLAACGADKSHPYRAFRRTHPAAFAATAVAFLFLSSANSIVAMAHMVLEMPLEC